MNPTPDQLLPLVQAGRLPEILRGELAVFRTPPPIDDDMRPTDHIQLLAAGLRPLAYDLGTEALSGLLEEALLDIASDAHGLFCAVQCLWAELFDEAAGESPLRLATRSLARMLRAALDEYGVGLHRLAFQPSDLASDRSWRITLARMRSLEGELGVDWGVALPAPTLAPLVLRTT